MARKSGAGDHALFQYVADHGTRWQYVIRADNQWAITRDGETIAAGQADQIGISAGVDQFLQLAGERDPTPTTAPAKAAKVLPTRHTRKQSCTS